MGELGNESALARVEGVRGDLYDRGFLQTIDVPPPVPANDPEDDDLSIVIEEVVRAVAKIRIILNQDLKKGFATVYDQCYQ